MLIVFFSIYLVSAVTRTPHELTYPILPRMRCGRTVVILTLHLGKRTHKNMKRLVQGQRSNILEVGITPKCSR